jgi:group II intron reverse transcriptase/maturase
MPPGPKKQKVHSLTGRITQPLLRRAFKAVKRNRGAAGIDKVSIKQFEANLGQNLQALEVSLKKGAFQPYPLRRKYIDKGGGKLRPLGIPAVRDRVAQMALCLLLTPIFAPLFHEASYGFIQGRNCHQALARALWLHEQGYRAVLDADIKGFFDNLPHKVIMAAVAAEIADGNILRLIEKFLRAGVMEDGVFKPTMVGTPQGGVISPLLANIVLNRLDWRLQQAGWQFVRYADDFAVLTRTAAQAKEALALVQQTLGELGLELSAEKTRITTYGKGYAFLGFWLASRSRRMRPKSEQKLQDKVRELTVRSHNLDAALIVKLNRVLRGTAQYFATRWSTGRKQFRLLDRWVRMRLRAMKFKRK